MLTQIAQDGKLHRRQYQLASVEPGFVGIPVDRESADRQLRRGLFRSAAHVVACVAAKLCFDTCHQFQRIERLCDVVVGAKCQSCDLVRVPDLGCQHDHGKIVLAADLPEQFHAVPVRKHHVQNSQRNILPLHNVHHARSPAACDDIVSLVLQIDPDQVRDLFLIIHNKYVHCNKPH